MSTTVSIRTTDDVRVYCIEVVRTIGGMTQDRTALATATITAVAFACARYADMVGHAMSPGDRARLWTLLSELWSDPSSHYVARDRLGQIASMPAIEALAASVPGTAWSELAEREVSRRRGEIADWGFDNGKLVVKKKEAPTP